jgi:hypothetical protein
MDLIKIFFDSCWNVQAFISRWIIVAAAVCLIAWLVYTRYFGRVLAKTFEIDEAEIGIGSQKLKIKPNYQDVQIAYKLWVELSTRKIGLPIDFENDVIVEVYDSWYEFFRLTRELIKDIPVVKIRRHESTRNLVTIAIDVLNEGLRPHLTLWQARFRRWYDAECQKEETRSLTPQETQKTYPDYARLTQDMKLVNEKLINYRQSLKTIAIGAP